MGPILRDSPGAQTWRVSRGKSGKIQKNRGQKNVYESLTFQRKTPFYIYRGAVETVGRRVREDSNHKRKKKASVLTDVLSSSGIKNLSYMFATGRGRYMKFFFFRWGSRIPAKDRIILGEEEPPNREFPTEGVVVWAKGPGGGEKDQERE